MSASTSPRHIALAVFAALVLAGGWAFGTRLSITTQVKLPTAIQLPISSAAQDAQSIKPPAALPTSIPKPLPVVVPKFAVAVESEESPLSSLHHALSARDEPDMTSLRSRTLVIPVQGVAAQKLSDTFTQARAGGVPHDALDIMASRGTPVLAVEDGRVAKLFQSKAGGITLYQFDPDSRYAYYYAHLDRYAEGLTEGASVRKGQVIGYVGSTGNASIDAPHLHFAIFRLESEHQWWRGTPLNPYLVWRDAKPKFETHHR